MIRGSYNAEGFTLVEIVIVMAIIGIMLSSVVFLGFAYINSVQMKTEKQGFTGQYNTYTAIARTSNYRQTQEYTDMTISIEENQISAEVTLDAGGTLSLGSYTLDDAILSFSGSDSGGSIDVTITPYQIGCDLIWISSLAASVTGVDLQMVSSINNDVYCFGIEDNTCKLVEQACP